MYFNGCEVPRTIMDVALYEIKHTIYYYKSGLNNVL